ncbi:unnamed protein product [Owenia fusiformis]|uniref:HIRA-interacting protein 3 n=1 Tax=Owenia fusiformis TaxID=6347 RepID=A0A8S4Q642_OWEFU|nr:unnamed protein product [Owenia fusiformis]
MEKFVRKLFKNSPNVGALTQKIVRQKYLEHFNIQTLVQQDKEKLKEAVLKIYNEGVLPQEEQEDVARKKSAKQSPFRTKQDEENEKRMQREEDGEHDQWKPKKYKSAMDTPTKHKKAKKEKTPTRKNIKISPRLKPEDVLTAISNSDPESEASSESEDEIESEAGSESEAESEVSDKSDQSDDGVVQHGKRKRKISESDESDTMSPFKETLISESESNASSVVENDLSDDSEFNSPLKTIKSKIKKRKRKQLSSSEEDSDVSHNAVGSADDSKQNTKKKLNKAPPAKKLKMPSKTQNQPDNDPLDWSSSDDDALKPPTNKKQRHDSSDSNSDKTPMNSPAKKTTKPKVNNKPKMRKHTSNSENEENSSDWSSSDDDTLKPLTNKKQHRHSNDSKSDNTPMNSPAKKSTKTKINNNLKKRKMENGSDSENSSDSLASSDSEIENKKLKKASRKKKDTKSKAAVSKKTTSSKPSQVTSGKLQKLQKICREAGLWYVHLFKECTTAREKETKILDFLAEKGFKGTPTLQAAQEYKLKKELADLGSESIIDSGRGKRKVQSLYNRTTNTSTHDEHLPANTSPTMKYTPVKEKFKNLKGIIDSDSESE